MTKHEINCTCALCMASVSRNAQVSKSETRTTPATDFAQYTRFELEEFAREQVALVANYQRFVLNQRDIIASLEREIEQRDKKIEATELARDIFQERVEHLEDVAQLAQESQGLDLRSITLDAIEESRINEYEMWRGPRPG